MNRRQFMMAAVLSMAELGWINRPSRVLAGDSKQMLLATFKKLETASGGRLGVAFIDTADGTQIGQWMDERFPMCSTFKTLAVAAVLSRADARKEDLARRVSFSKTDLVSYSPVTEGRAGGSGMSILELCEAAITRSDNTAANLLLASVGGPANVNAFVRTLGDQVTRLDRIEPDVNECLDGDPRDTTTPMAMASSFRSLVCGEALSPKSRDQLIEWLVASKTGDTRLRAGLPAGWRVGDKTGSGSHGTSNDVAVIWPSRHAPIIVSVYLTGAKVTPDQQYATIAAVGRSIAATIEP
ncbi:MAG: Beta-lactamase [Tardiphaga sp.]|nr:Beta-lactamase [Tardiphaga sp.]